MEEGDQTGRGGWGGGRERGAGGGIGRRANLDSEGPQAESSDSVPRKGVRVSRGRAGCRRRVSCSQSWRHTPSIASVPAPSSKLCQIWLRQGTLCLRAAVHRRGQRPPKGLDTSHTPSIAFRHLPPNSARFGYATEGALFISVQLSTDAVSALRKVWGRDTTAASKYAVYCLWFGY